jgi:hypothetical protein
MGDQQQPDPPRDPLAVSATGAFLGVAAQVAVTPDGKVVVPVDLAVVRKR